MSRARSNVLLLAAGLLIGAGVGLALLLGFGVGRDWLAARLKPAALQDGAGPAGEPPGAPDFKLEALDGTAVRLSDLQGAPVVINFWATWCGPCQTEMPLLQDYADRYTGQVQVLAVNDGESPGDIQAFADRLGLHLPILLDPGSKVTATYLVRGFPTTIFVNAQGQVKYKHIGILSEKQLASYLEKLGVGP